MVACGGGGGSSAPIASNLVVTGTAATGLANAGATVTGKCKVGTGTAITLTDGSYALTITDGQWPCLLQITNPVDGTKLHTVATGTGGTAVANITPLTEMVTARVLAIEPNVFFAAFDGATLSQKVTSITVQAAITEIGLVLTGTVDTSALGNFISTQFKAATQNSPTTGDAQDKLLDALKLKLSSTQIGTLVTAMATGQTTDALLQMVIGMTTMPNISPIASAGNAQSVAAGSVVILDGSASSDANNDPLTSAWTLISKPVGSVAALSSSTSTAPSFTADLPGTYVVGLTVNDGKLNSLAVSVSIAATRSVTIVEVSSASSVSFAVSSDGRLFAWGVNNWCGILGDGSTNNISLPKQIGTGFKSVSTTSINTIALKTDGSLWAWGCNQDGFLGDGTYLESPVPKLIGTGYSYIAASTRARYAIKSDGTLWAWGNIGTLGDGTADPSRVPKQIASGFTAVAPGLSNVIALKIDGSLWAWGDGLLGDGTNSSSLSPKLIDSGYIAIAAASGSNVDLALKSDGSLWAWGVGQLLGQLADGTPIDQSLIPREIDTGYKFISVGWDTAFAIKSDGGLWGWGDNSWSQLADGTNRPSRVPKYIGAGYAAIAANPYAPLAIKIDGSLWRWGLYAGGQQVPTEVPIPLP
jgi:alpha-tubulin suppressor-like RCC1 family protein